MKVAGGKLSADPRRMVGGSADEGVATAGSANNLWHFDWQVLACHEAKRSEMETTARIVVSGQARFLGQGNRPGIQPKSQPNIWPPPAGQEPRFRFRSPAKRSQFIHSHMAIGPIRRGLTKLVLITGY